MPGDSIVPALVTRSAPGYVDRLRGLESAVCPFSWLGLIDALVTRSAPGFNGGGPPIWAFLGIVSFLPAQVAGLSVS